MKHQYFIARQKHIALDGLAPAPIDIAYTDVGSGDPLILMHGIPTWSFLYHQVIDRLSESYRVIAPDFIGHGSSDKRDGLDRSLLAQRDMISAFMDALSVSKATLIGHDTGGGVALIMGVENADRVDQLVLSNIVAYDSWPIDDMIQVGHPGWAKKSNDEIRDFLVGGFDDGLSRKDQLTPEFVNGIVAPYTTDEGKVSLIRNASSLNTNHTTMLIGRHQQIKAKTLLVWGEDDPWQSIADGEKLASEIPDATLVRVQNASHWIPQDAPDDWLVHVLPFLSQ
ncbi:alpha/beta hydrolase [Roseibium sp. HPY-6]|uniref:alpha/beta fold hydrolase n=1 Tax=Roseibium sp. HPY-6 TaxID=3229852 RepID=UPI00338F6798